MPVYIKKEKFIALKMLTSQHQCCIIVKIKK